MVKQTELNYRMGKRVPLIIQSEAAECGLTCISMIAAYYQKPLMMTKLRAQFGASIKGHTLKDLISISNELGLGARPLRLELDELHKLKMPCILHWDLNHFVVLKKVSGDKVVINDPAIGEVRYDLKHVSNHFTGVAVELTPTKAFKKATKTSGIKFIDVLGSIQGLGRVFAFLFTVAIFLEILALISPLFMTMVTDEAIPSQDRNLLYSMAGVFFIVMVIQTGVGYLRSYATMAITQSMRIQSRQNLVLHLMRLPVNFFEARHLGDILSRFGSQEAVLNTLTATVIGVIIDGMVAVVTLGVIVYTFPELAALAVMSCVSYVLMKVAFIFQFRQLQQGAIHWDAQAETHILESLRGIKALKMFGAQDVRATQWVNLNVESANLGIKMGRLDLNIGVFNQLVSGGTNILGILLGALAIFDGRISLGLLLAFLTYFRMFTARVFGLIDTAADIWLLRLHAERVADIAFTEPEKHEASLPPAIKVNKPIKLDVRGVAYRYAPTLPLTLQGVSFTINEGECVAICGPSGGGKSTLAKVISSMVPPLQGDLFVDGEHLKTYGVDRYRSEIGMVLQDDSLFSGSISENISFFDDNEDKDFVRYCAKLANIEQDILAMPMDFMTLVGDMGTTLSGGQKQRVLLARALYRRPRLMILDESTSHLDITNEKVVMDHISDMQTTRILIAHRPQTIQYADRVLVVEKGRVREGKKEEFDPKNPETLRLLGA